MSTSLTTRSKGARRQPRERRSAPSPATSTAKPSSSRIRRSSRAWVGLSSTTRTCGALIGRPFGGGGGGGRNGDEADHRGPTWSRGRMKSASPAFTAAAGHAVDDGRRLGLRDRAAAGIADGAEAVDPVASHAGEDHGHRARARRPRPRTRRARCPEGRKPPTGGAGERWIRRVGETHEVLVVHAPCTIVPGGEHLTLLGQLDAQRRGLVQPVREAGAEAARDVLDDEDRERESRGKPGQDPVDGRRAAGGGGDGDRPARPRRRRRSGARAAVSGTRAAPARSGAPP